MWEYSKPIEYFGKASFEIFLVQMVFYNFVNGIIGKVISNPYIHLCSNLLICLAIGSLFYKVNMPITKLLTKFITRKIN